MSYIPDYNNAKDLQLSNDAFFYLLLGEEPIDEDNLDEAKEIAGLFPNGFMIDETWDYVEGTDLIAAKFIPYIEESFEYDEYLDLTTELQLQIKWLDTNHISTYWLNKKTNARTPKGQYEIKTDKYGHKYFQTGDYTKGKGSLYFLKHFNPKK